MTYESTRIVDNFKDDYNVLVELDGLNINQEDMNNIQLIHPILTQNLGQEGTFQLGNLKLTIKKLVENTIIDMTNPVFDKNLLTIE